MQVRPFHPGLVRTPLKADDESPHNTIIGHPRKKQNEGNVFHEYLSKLTEAFGAESGICGVNAPFSSCLV